MTPASGRRQGVCTTREWRRGSPAPLAGASRLETVAARVASPPSGSQTRDSNAPPLTGRQASLPVIRRQFLSGLWLTPSTARSVLGGCRHDSSLAPGSDSCGWGSTHGPSGRPPRMGGGRTDQRVTSDHEGIHHADIRLRMHTLRRVRAAAVDLGARARAMPELRRRCTAADRRRDRLRHEGTSPFWESLRPHDALLRARNAL